MAAGHGGSRSAALSFHCTTTLAISWGHVCAHLKIKNKSQRTLTFFRSKKRWSELRGLDLKQSENNKQQNKKSKHAILAC
jgi:hypothetical protein